MSTRFKILVPFDFTEASEKALQQAVMLREEFPVHVELLHVIDSEKQAREAEEHLSGIIKRFSEQNVSVGFMVEKGGILTTINKVAAKGHFDLMLLGTHGPRGLRQNLLGADILKLLKESPCAAIVVQKTSEPVDQFKRILLQVGSHDNYPSLVSSVKTIALASRAEVVIYTIRRPDESLPAHLVENKENTIRDFDASGVKYREVTEDASVYSFGFAKQALMYAENNGVDLIAIMPHSSAENSYFANADKERLLVNERGIAVLSCAGV
jgi:nucleotide-binding universal stress UspA family protein